MEYVCWKMKQKWRLTPLLFSALSESKEHAHLVISRPSSHLNPPSPTAHHPLPYLHFFSISLLCFSLPHLYVNSLKLILMEAFACPIPILFLLSCMWWKTRLILLSLSKFLLVSVLNGDNIKMKREFSILIIFFMDTVWYLKNV